MTSELPPAGPSPAPHERTYTLRGLAQRDATVFKSILRLLAGKTRDRWTAVDTGPADLLVVAGGSPVQAADTVRPRMQVLRVEAAGRGARADTLVLPLRAEEVCTQLDRAGERLAAMPSRSAAVSCRLQLTRWPSAQLLGTDPHYLRLATILGTRPTTLDELAEKSDCPDAVCEAFAATMHVNGAGRWIVEPLAEAAPVLHPVAGTGRDEVPAGLLSRIRSRLSL